jgi:hypothetical protein
VGKGVPAPWEGGGIPQVTATRAFSGKNSVTIADGYDGVSLSLPLNPARDVVFARVMVWSEFVPQTQGESRWGLAFVSTDTGEVLTLDITPNLTAFHPWSGGEDATESKSPLTSGAWKCLEMSFDRTTSTVSASIDGGTKFVAPLGGPAIAAKWTSFHLQNTVYHGGSNTVFYDDVALGTAPLGCPSP